ncbi:heat shock protein HslJ [Kibdelosporangium banguiense]|uniref:Heat shock protein HslJ n=1 Tax=Kibdelosporangium banguiense TaxID=1365924 RepID=A0ABS4TEJ2_9PSEU|nr:META domain-containing protein [Kibdelosporangium banguiense]MBP2322825.1 heat shock protein HslJ [Kibdelosporangium banguiense]
MPQQQELKGRAFVAESVSVQGKPRPMVGGTQVTLDFTEDGRLLAKAGCNMMGGRVATGDGRLKADSLEMTEMGCDRARHEQDTWLAGVIESGPAFRFDGTTLKLTSADTEIVLTAKKDLPLTGTQWQLESVTTGELAQSTQSTATLVFADNAVTVTTECNSGRAGYRMAGDRITFEPVGLTRKACPDELMQAEQAIVPVLDGEVTFRIKNESLELRHPSGNGLRLVHR